MTLNDDQITNALLDAFPVANGRNWGDVEHRAAAHRAAARRRVIVAVFASLAVLLAGTPATGIVGRVRDLFEGTPAPPAVQTAMGLSDALRNQLYIRDAGQFLHDRYSPVIAAETRGVVSADTPDGPIYVWAAPTRDGRECWLVQAGENKDTGRPYGTGSCDPSHPPAMLSGGFWTAARPSVYIVHARVYDSRATSVRVEVPGGTDVVAPVIDGHALTTVPRATNVASITLVALDQTGNEVTRASR